MADMSDKPVWVPVRPGYRWTVRGVDERLVRRVKVKALLEDRTLADVVNELLQRYVNEQLELPEAAS